MHERNRAIPRQEGTCRREASAGAGPADSEMRRIHPQFVPVQEAERGEAVVERARVRRLGASRYSTATATQPVVAASESRNGASMS